MSVVSIITDILLALTVLSVWVGVLGMLRMRTPLQALHYVALPGSLGFITLSAAVFLHVGMHAAAWKTALIALALFGLDAVVAHAVARAFLVRERGNWHHRHGDEMGIVEERA